MSYRNAREIAMTNKPQQAAQATKQEQQPPPGRQRVLFLCTGNSARSQMAEALLSAMAGDRYDVFSAGTKPSVVNPLAIEAMLEMGMDISAQRSKHLDEYIKQPFDYVITVCDNAAETCPAFPGRAERVHWSFPDPALAQGTHEERLAVFRRTRDAITSRLTQWLS
jgi:arsenate reductase